MARFLPSAALDEVDQRVVDVLTALPAALHVAARIESRIWIAQLARTGFEVVKQRIEIRLFDLGIGIAVVGLVEEAGILDETITAEQRGHGR